MGKYIGKRMIHLVGILVALSFLTFLLMYLAPGDAATKKLNAQGVAVSQEVLEQTRRAMGLDRPFLVQYGDWATKVLRGDLGESYKDGQSVALKLGKAMGYTAQLALGSMLISLAVCYLFGSAWLAHQAHMSFSAALAAGVIPFIPGDLVKIAIVLLIGPEIRKRLRQAGLPLTPASSRDSFR